MPALPHSPQAHLPAPFCLHIPAAAPAQLVGRVGGGQLPHKAGMRWAACHLVGELEAELHTKPLLGGAGGAGRWAVAGRAALVEAALGSRWLGLRSGDLVNAQTACCRYSFNVPVTCVQP
jgi:hypothetical protein